MATPIVSDAPEGQPAPRSLVGIDGPSAGNFRMGKVHATCINPAAPPRELVSWAYGQVKEMAFILSIMSSGTSNCEYSVEDVASSFLHFLEPVETVLEVAGDKLAFDELREGGEA